jgi:hypothetical protein
MNWFQKLLTLLSAVILVTVLGCSVVKQDDGTLGIKVGMSKEAHATIQNQIDTASGWLGALSSIFPALTPVAAAAGVGGYTWKRMKKTVTKNRKPLEMLVRSLEQVKETDTEAWEKIRVEIKKQYPTIDIKGTIEEIQTELRKTA